MLVTFAREQVGQWKHLKQKAVNVFWMRAPSLTFQEPPRVGDRRGWLSNLAKIYIHTSQL